MMLDAAKRLIAPSARSDVPPFMVMDVMAAAARIEARRRPRHPHGGRPAGRAGAVDRARRRAGGAATGRLGYTEALGIPSLRARIARHYAETYGVDGRPGARRRHHRLVGRIHPGVPGAVRARRPRRGRRAGLSAVPPHPHGARLRAGADRDHGRRRAGRSRREMLLDGASRARRSRACWSRARPIRPAP